jgi:RND superfamily putative drug exporter
VLLIARLPLFARLGPSLAFSVAVAVVVSVTLLPAALGILGRRTFWPSERHGAADDDPVLSPVFRRRLTAGPVAILVAGLLVAAPLVLGPSVLGINLIRGLPESSEAATAARQAAKGLSPGIIGPLEVMLEGQQVTDRRNGLEAVQRELARRPGIAGVLGPAQQPLPFDLGIFLARSGDAARYVVILDDDPFSASGLHRIQELRADMPAILDRAGLAGIRASFTGDVVLGATLARMATHDLVRVAIGVLVVDLLILGLFLRAVLAPLLLAGSTALSVVAALSLTAWASREALDVHGLTFYVPLAAAVLLLSFGTDYNLLVTGRIWKRATHLGVRDAVGLAGREARLPVTAAGLALAFSFALLALVPVVAFRQVAAAMFIGVLLEAVAVALVFVPSALSLFGSWAASPNRAVSRGAVSGVAGRRPTARGDATYGSFPNVTEPSRGFSHRRDRERPFRRQEDDDEDPNDHRGGRLGGRDPGRRLRRGQPGRQ